MEKDSDIQIPTGNARLCISVASRPSQFGITVHNAGYRALGLDFFYKAIQANDIRPVVSAVRTLNIRGCSVSMPFKQTVIPLLDDLDPVAARIGAVNTIVNDGEKLTGYNTDAYGARMAIEGLEQNKPERVLVMGGGGVARAILTTLQDIGVHNISIALRHPEAGKDLVDQFGATLVPWDQVPETDIDLLINASPVGMAPDTDGMPVQQAYLARCRAVMDVVASPAESKLIKTARTLNIPSVTGLTMTMHQAAKQFELYTGRPAPMDTMWSAFQALTP